MSEKTIELYQPMTWAGINYGVGENTLPEEAATYAKKRGFTVGGDVTEEVEIKPQSPFPEDYPGFDVLGQVEGMTPESVAAMSDEDILAIKGIGAATLKQIRAYK